MSRNRKHNRADFPLLQSVCKASSQLPFLLFPHCLLSKSLSATPVCVYAWPCEELPTPPSLWPKILSLFHHLLSSICPLSCHYHCLTLHNSLKLSRKFQVSPSVSQSLMIRCATLLGLFGKCHFPGMWIFAYLKDDTCMYRGGVQEKPCCSSESCSKTGQ